MATTLVSFTFGVTVIEKLEWIIKNSYQKNKSAFISRLVELEYLKIKSAKEKQAP